MISNLQLPYHIVQTDDLAYKFITQSGVVYAAYFIDISEAFGADHVYTFSFDAEFSTISDIKYIFFDSYISFLFIQKYDRSSLPLALRENTHFDHFLLSVDILHFPVPEAMQWFLCICPPYQADI